MPRSMLAEPPGLEPGLARQLDVLRDSLEQIAPRPDYRRELRVQLVAQAERAARPPAPVLRVAGQHRTRPRTWVTRRMLGAGAAAALAGGGLATAASVSHSHGGRRTPAALSAPAPPSTHSPGTAGLPTNRLLGAADDLATAQAAWEAALRAHAAELVLRSRLTALADAGAAVLGAPQAAPQAGSGLPAVDGPVATRLAALASRGQAVLAFVRPTLPASLGPLVTRAAASLAGIQRATAWTPASAQVSGGAVPTGEAPPRAGSASSAAAAPTGPSTAAGSAGGFGGTGGIGGTGSSAPSAPGLPAPAVPGASRGFLPSAPVAPAVPSAPLLPGSASSAGLLPPLISHTAPPPAGVPSTSTAAPAPVPHAVPH